MNTISSTDNRTANSFAVSFSVAMILFSGFVAAATGVILTSAALAITGTLLMLGGLALYGILIE